MKRKTILIADDEPNIRLLVRNMLSKDYLVIGASDGEEAINIAKRRNPDLILMDIVMPKVDGYSACYAVKTHPTIRTIPVVMLTGIGYEINKKLAFSFASFAFLVASPFFFVLYTFNSIPSLENVFSTFESFALEKEPDAGLTTNNAFMAIQNKL